MAYTSPAPWSGGQLVGAADLNAQLQQNMLWVAGTAGIVTQASYNAVATGGSTGSASLALINAPQVGGFVTQGSGTVTVSFSLGVSHSAAGVGCWFGVFVDGVNASGTVIYLSSPPTINTFFAGIGTYTYSPTAGTHLYQIGWATASGTLSVNTNANNWISVMELRR